MVETTVPMPMSAEELDRSKVVRAHTADKLEDAVLVERARADDPWAKEVLFRRYFEAIALTVLRIVGSSAEAEDIVQETFVVAISDLGKLRDPRALKSWLLGIAIRKTQRFFRRRKMLRLLGLDRTVDDATLDRLAAADASPEVCAELALLDRSLAGIPSPERIAWVLRQVEGFTLAEVALACDCSLATVKRRIARAEAQISAHIGEEDTDG